MHPTLLIHILLQCEMVSFRKHVLQPLTHNNDYIFHDAQLKNCQWLADFSHMMGVNWKEEVSLCGCDVSEVHVVPKPVDAITVVKELKHFAKYALQIAQGWEVDEE